MNYNLEDLKEDVCGHLWHLNIKENYRLHFVILYIYWKSPQDFSEECCEAYKEYVDFLYKGRLKRER